MAWPLGSLGYAERSQREGWRLGILGNAEKSWREGWPLGILGNAERSRGEGCDGGGGETAAVSAILGHSAISVMPGKSADPYTYI
jgi:hypothetical protein